MASFKEWLVDEPVKEGLGDFIKSQFSNRAHEERMQNKAKQYLYKYYQDTGLDQVLRDHPHIERQVEQAATNIILARMFGIGSITRSDLETLWLAARKKIKDENGQDTTITKEFGIGRPLSLVEKAPKDSKIKWKIESSAAAFDQEIQKKRAMAKLQPARQPAPPTNPAVGPGLPPPGSQPTPAPANNKSDHLVIEQLPDLPPGTQVDLDQIANGSNSQAMVYLQSLVGSGQKLGVLRGGKISPFGTSALMRLKMAVRFHQSHGGGTTVTV